MSAVSTINGLPTHGSHEDDASFSTTVKTAAPLSVGTSTAAPPNRSAADHQPVWGFTGSDRWLIAVSLTIMAGLLTAHVWRDQERAATPVQVVHPEGKYQFHGALNSATWVEWAQLDGIGEKLARRIVADREERGPFATIDDLRRVKGIGPKTLEKMRPYVVVDEPE